MRSKVQHKKGFILTLTLMILAIGLLIVSQFLQRGMVYLSFERMMIDREKAKILVTSSFQFAISQLTLLNKKAESKETSDQKTFSQSSSQIFENFLEHIFPIIGSWQEIVLKETNENITGTIRFCLTCENGKIPLNTIFDFKQKKFKGEGAAQGDMKKALQALFGNMKKFTQNKDLFDVFEKILKQRDYKFNDVNELLADDVFFKIFQSLLIYEPKDEKNKKETIYLGDLFSAYTQEISLHPLLLSESILEILMIKPGYGYDVKRRKEFGMKMLKSIKKSPITNVQNLWDSYLHKEFGKEFKTLLPGFASLLALKFEPSIFSVLCYATVGQVTQKALGIIEKKKLADDETFVLKKLYWL